ncbi:MAG: acetate uptake transporter [Geobacteraceae bacterium]
MAEETTFSIVNQAVADPSTVGLASFGIALFTLSFHNAGLLSANDMSILVPLAFVTGLIHFFACLTGFKKNELFTAVVFGIYGMFWMVYSLINLGVVLKWYELDAKALLIFLIAYTIFTAIIFIATLVTNKAVILTLAVLLAVFLCLDFGLVAVLSGQETKLITWAGYLGMVDGLLALYLTAAGLLATMFGRAVLPVGPVK